MSYHKRVIEKGVLGEPSKIKEEFEEFMDCVDQDNTLMGLFELSDMIGAIESYVKKYNLTLDDIIKMKNATANAFESGRRVSTENEGTSLAKVLSPFKKTAKIDGTELVGIYNSENEEWEIEDGNWTFSTIWDPDIKRVIVENCPLEDLIGKTVTIESDFKGKSDMVMINDSGGIVGVYDYTLGRYHAHDGNSTPLNWSFQVALDSEFKEYVVEDCGQPNLNGRTIETIKLYDK